MVQCPICGRHHFGNALCARCSAMSLTAKIKVICNSLRPRKILKK